MHDNKLLNESSKQRHDEEKLKVFRDRIGCSHLKIIGTFIRLSLFSFMSDQAKCGNWISSELTYFLSTNSWFTKTISTDALNIYKMSGCNLETAVKLYFLKTSILFWGVFLK